MPRQYEPFHPIVLSSRNGSSPAIGGFGFLGDLVIYRDPEGGKELLSKEEFVYKYRFEPGEEYLVAVPDYNTPVKESDVFRGAPSLEAIQPDLFAEKFAQEQAWQIAETTADASAQQQALVLPFLPPMGIPKLKKPKDYSFPVPGMLPTPKLPRNGFPPEITIVPPPPPPPPPPDGQCCLPVRICCSEDYSAMAQASPPASAVATAYGGQSIVQIGSPGADVAATAPEGGTVMFDAGPPPPYGYATQSELAVMTEPGGLLDMIRPRSNSDWLKIGAGFLAGWLVARWWEKKK